jgi:hypothetical protein
VRLTNDDAASGKLYAFALSGALLSLQVLGSPLRLGVDVCLGAGPQSVLATTKIRSLDTLCQAGHTNAAIL